MELKLDYKELSNNCEKNYDTCCMQELFCEWKNLSRLCRTSLEELVKRGSCWPICLTRRRKGSNSVQKWKSLAALIHKTSSSKKNALDFGNVSTRIAWLIFVFEAFNYNNSLFFFSNRYLLFYEEMSVCLRKLIFLFLWFVACESTQCPRKCRCLPFGKFAKVTCVGIDHVPPGIPSNTAVL